MAHGNQILLKKYMLEKLVWSLLGFLSLLDAKIILQVIAIFPTNVFAERLWDWVKVCSFHSGYYIYIEEYEELPFQVEDVTTKG